MQGTSPSTLRRPSLDLNASSSGSSRAGMNNSINKVTNNTSEAIETSQTVDRPTELAGARSSSFQRGLNIEPVVDLSQDLTELYAEYLKNKQGRSCVNCLGIRRYFHMNISTFELQQVYNLSSASLLKHSLHKLSVSQMEVFVSRARLTLKTTNNTNKRQFLTVLLRNVESYWVPLEKNKLNLRLAPPPLDRPPFTAQDNKQFSSDSSILVRISKIKERVSKIITEDKTKHPEGEAPIDSNRPRERLSYDEYVSSQALTGHSSFETTPAGGGRPKTTPVSINTLASSSVDDKVSAELEDYMRVRLNIASQATGLNGQKIAHALNPIPPVSPTDSKPSRQLPSYDNCPSSLPQKDKRVRLSFGTTPVAGARPKTTPLYKNSPALSSVENRKPEPLYDQVPYEELELSCDDVNAQKIAHAPNSIPPVSPTASNRSRQVPSYDDHRSSQKSMSQPSRLSFGTTHAAGARPKVSRPPQGKKPLNENLEVVNNVMGKRRKAVGYSDSESDSGKEWDSESDSDSKRELDLKENKKREKIVLAKIKEEAEKKSRESSAKQKTLESEVKGVFF